MPTEIENDIKRDIKKNKADIAKLTKRVRRLERLLERAENADEWPIEHVKIQEGRSHEGKN